jgi:hypothetical protein
VVRTKEAVLNPCLSRFVQLNPEHLYILPRSSASGLPISWLCRRPPLSFVLQVEVWSCNTTTGVATRLG